MLVKKFVSPHRHQHPRVVQFADQCVVLSLSLKLSGLGESPQLTCIGVIVVVNLNAIVIIVVAFVVRILHFDFLVIIVAMGIDVVRSSFPIVLALLLLIFPDPAAFLGRRRWSREW